MKTTIVIKQKSFAEQIKDSLQGFVFKIYSFIHTLIKHPKRLGEAYWSNSDCYIEIGKSGYISHEKMFDLNGDVTVIKELVLSENKPVKLDLSETEIMKIQNIADKKNISMKELLMFAIEKLQKTEQVTK